MKTSSWFPRLLWLLCLFSAALAGAAPSFKEHYQQGLTHYEAGRYPEALRSFEEAYAIQPLPRLLINIGQAHRRLGHPRDALTCFERFFQQEPAPPPEVRARVEGYMEAIRQQLAPAPAPAPVPSAPALLPQAQAQAPPPAPPRSRWRSPWLWTAVGVLVAAGVTGGVLGAVYGGGGSALPGDVPVYAPQFPLRGRP